MASTADFRNGFTFRYNNDIYTIVEFQHVKPGKGGAFVRTKLKSFTTGKVIDVTFRSGEKVDEVRVERRKMSYSYKRGNLYYLLDEQTWEEKPVEEEKMEDCLKYLQEGMELGVLLTENDKVLDIELPFFVELEVVETEPYAKGDTVSSSYKPATVETGAAIMVPPFVEVGDVIKIDTREDKYLERVT